MFDKERSRDNVEFCHSDIKQVYHELFDEALERYNAKQKRSDRKIDDYYEKIRQGKQGFHGGTREATEWNRWIEAEKQELSKVMERYGVEWL